MVPERDICGLVYCYHRPNMNLSAGGPTLWDTGGREIYDCLYWDWDTCQPFPHGAEMFDFTLRNSTCVETLELQKSYRMRYKQNGCSIDLTWDSIMEPQENKRAADDLDEGLAEWVSRPEQAEYPYGHYEQPGHIQGTIELDRTTLAVDAFSIRDHSWGPRPLRSLPRAGYGWAIASDTSSFRFLALSDLPASSDPIVGTTERVVSGWYQKDGVKGDLVAGERQVLERDDTGRPLHEVVVAQDHLGRTLRAEGRPVNVLNWTGYTNCFNRMQLTRWTCQDGQEIWGEMHEYYTFAHHRQLSRPPIHRHDDEGCA